MVNVFRFMATAFQLDCGHQNTGHKSVIYMLEINLIQAE
jgi:hypothetical protein